MTTDRVNWRFKLGMKAYRDGRPRPDHPADDATVEGMACWLGFMAARAMEFIERRRVEDALRPDPHDPRPRKAA